MLHRLSSLLFFLSGVHAMHAQCNPAEYTRIFTEANILQSKGEFIESKNRYEAAKIYACNQKQKDAADSRIDALFEQIDRLRLQAYANDLSYKSNTALRDGDRNTAFRLAEFAYRYVDSTNTNVLASMMNAVYYNDHPDSTHRLPRCFNLGSHLLSITAEFTADGKRLITNALDKSGKPVREALIWNIATRRIEKTIRLGDKTQEEECWFRTTLSPDGKWLAANCTVDNSVEIWDMATQKRVYVFTGSESSVTDFIFSPDSKLLAAGLDNKTVKIWEVQTGREAAVLNGYTADVNGLSFSFDGWQLAVVCSDTVNIWDTHTYTLLSTVSDSQGYNRIKCVALSPHSDLLVLGLEEKFEIWNVQKKRLTKTIFWSDERQYMELRKLAFSPDGRYVLAVAINPLEMVQMVQIWDIETGKTLMPLAGQVKWITDASFSKDGRYVSTCSLDGTVKIWDLQSEKASVSIPSEAYAGSIRFSPVWKPNGNVLAIGNNEGAIDMWNAAHNRMDLKLENQKIRVWDLAYAPDGKRLASLMGDSTIQIWDLEHGSILCTLIGIKREDGNVSFSPDGKKICSAEVDNTVKIREIETGKVITSIEKPEQNISSAFFSPDGLQVAMLLDNTKVEIWNLKTNKTVWTFADTARVLAFAFSPDGNFLATGLDDNTSKVWDVKNGKIRNVLPGDIARVGSVNFSPDSRYLATGTTGGFLEYDKTAKIWDLQSGKVIYSLEGNEDNVSSAVFSPDGQQLATLSDGKVKLWELSGAGLIDRWNATGPSAELIAPQLQQYNLESLLDQQAGNETRLISTGDVQQIIAFADLASAQASGSNLLAQVEPHYSRADRLYAAALHLQDSEVIRQEYSRMLRRWAMVYASDGLKSRAAELEAKADGLWKK